MTPGSTHPSALAAIDSVSPASLAQGARDQLVTITGSGFQGRCRTYTVTFSGSGVTATGAERRSDTVMTAYVTVGYGFFSGLRDVTASGSGGCAGFSFTGTGRFTVTPFQPVGIAVGLNHSCALTRTGGVKCWGDNRRGQLGDGTTVSSPYPVDVTGLATGVLKISAGQVNTCVLTRSHGVKCWGDNSGGQLGDGTTTSSPIPVDVTGLESGVEAVAVGWRHACALVTGGGVKCWGAQGGVSARTTPADVLGLSGGAGAISAGYYYTCADSNMGVKCWGDNRLGQLGNGTTTASDVPVDVTGLASGVLGIYAGGEHTCALTNDHGVTCWGNNAYGQLGDGSTVNSSVPVKAAGIVSNAWAIAVGGAHTCAYTDNGVVCWGRNVDGQLGDGTTMDRRSPVMVSGLAGPASIDAAPKGGHTCAVGLGWVKCWGSNHFGQLGDGTRTSSSVPVDVDLRIHPKIGLWSSVPSGTIDPGTTVRFTATVRPLDLSGVRPVVRFVISRQDEDGTWRSAGSRDVTADATGRARLRWGFVTPGLRRVSARVLPDAAYGASTRSLPVSYTVRPGATPTPPGIILSTPPAGATIAQNDPSTGCSPANPKWGHGFAVSFDWTAPAVGGLGAYRLVVQHVGSLNPALDVRVAASSFAWTACNSFVVGGNLDNWHWQVTALDKDQQVIAVSEQRAISFLPCRLADGTTPCSAPG